MKKNINRSIEAYADSDYETFKTYERYQFLLKRVSDKVEQHGAGCSVLDIGCAKGEFLYLMRQRYPELSYFGIDYSEQLLQMAKNEKTLSQVSFIRGDACRFHLEKDFSVTVMSGVLSIFDDISKPIECMVRHTAQGGTGFIFSAFSGGDIDVLVRFKNNHLGSTQWESGWNMFSINTIRKELKKLGARLTSVQPFEIKQHLERQENPVASYTVETKDGNNIILTGGNIRRQFSLLEFERTKG